MLASVLGLEEYGLNLATLGALGDKKVSIRANLKLPNRLFTELKPAERLKRIVAIQNRRFRQIQRKWPQECSTKVMDVDYPRSFKSSAAARDLPRLRRIPGISCITVERIAGLKRRKNRPAKRWFAVHGLVAVQVEGRRKGYQPIEDRIVLVKAVSESDADRRLRREWKAYASPYLNNSGELVRWQLESIVDIYDTMEEDLEPSGAEVYARLGKRRLRREYEWHP
jgi:hypothetical protein